MAMFRWIHSLTVGLGLWALSAGAWADDNGPRQGMERGHQIALKICSACHAVATDQEFSPLLNPPAPPFADIANRTKWTRASLRHFIVATHWDEKTLPLTMPNPQLMDFQVADVVSYILSLRTH
jgi:mono/diheme cytochrome c family protein